MGSQLSAISPFKRNHLIGLSGTDNLSGASSVTSWTDKSFNPYSPACNSSLITRYLVLSDNDSVHSESQTSSRRANSSANPRGERGFSQGSFQNNVQIAPNQYNSGLNLLRRNSGQNSSGFGDISPKVLPHSGSGYIPSGSDLAAFYSSDDNLNDSSQVSEGRSNTLSLNRLESKTGTGKSLFFRKQSSRGLGGGGFAGATTMGQLMNKSKFCQDYNYQ